MVNILLTGPPRCGKTTTVKALIHAFPGRKASGFFTAEVREGGSRVGFELATLDGQKGLLAHIRIRSPARVGRYGVDVEGFERIALPAIRPRTEVELILIDEIGKMECFSAAFRSAVLEALEAPPSVLATIVARGDIFIESLKKRPDVHVVHLERGRGSGVVERLAQLLGWLE